MELVNHLYRLQEMSFKARERMPYKVAKALADTVKQALVANGLKDSDIEYGGSLRREASTVGDVDIAVFDNLVNADTWRKVIASLEGAGHRIEQTYKDPTGLVRKMPLGDMQTSFLLDGNNVDIKKYSPVNRGAMMVHITGDANFNIGMRAWLKSFGWGFSQAGLKDEKGQIIAAENERDIFNKLGMVYIEPRNRIGFRPPKNPPPGAKIQGREEPRYEAGIPADIYQKVPDDVKDGLKTFKVPDRDTKGNAIPKDFMYNPVARHNYYKRGGMYRLPDEFKLDRYSKTEEHLGIGLGTMTSFGSAGASSE